MTKQKNVKIEIYKTKHKKTKTQIRILNPIKTRTRIIQLEGIMVAKQNIKVITHEKINTTSNNNQKQGGKSKCSNSNIKLTVIS